MSVFVDSYTLVFLDSGKFVSAQEFESFDNAYNEMARQFHSHNFHKFARSNLSRSCASVSLKKENVNLRWYIQKCLKEYKHE